MGKKIRKQSDLSQNHDQKFVKTSSYLHTEKEHKKWFKEANLGKQRGKPKQRVKE